MEPMQISDRKLAIKECFASRRRLGQIALHFKVQLQNKTKKRGRNVSLTHLNGP